ncbi:Caspase domain protein [Novipirellula galeiformis]|uniref:Caspase domain protein n=1 Tax=Novipirellula galeiformis TaxID=2528004 RepID=A0A5C6CEE4_9BACT|nr:hypothetical protein [Novipirellula galeiformis]TWU22127.1 Caspase domain protein [Novipirellula galeiformis]
MRSLRRVLLVLAACSFATSHSATAADFFLTIGGGYSPSGNQASLERNVLFFQRLLKQHRLDENVNDIYFSDGDHPDDDLQVIDRTSIPKANQLMAEFFGSQRDLGLSYRNHEIDKVRGSTSPKNIQQWFDDVGSTMEKGDRLVLYVTAHGNESQTRNHPYNTSISLWNHRKITVSELSAMLDQLPEGVSVVTIMVQCHAGGFARLVYNEGDPDKGRSSQTRSGFFATVHDRPAAGCTPEIDEATYVEYSTYFWEAIAGRTRLDQPIELPDYNQDGVVSFEEAHAYTILKSDTIDLPIKTSGEFLGEESLFQDEQHPELLPRDLAYDELITFATASDRAVLEGLSEQLDLQGENRLEVAEQKKEKARPRGRRRARNTDTDSSAALRRKIATDMRSRWPGLANPLNPIGIELMTTRSDDFIRAIEVHPDYANYRELANTSKTKLSDREKEVKYERFIRTVENVILRENLIRMGNANTIAAFEAILEGETASLGSPKRQ